MFVKERKYCRNDHTIMTAPLPVCSPKLSMIWPRFVLRWGTIGISGVVLLLNLVHALLPSWCLIREQWMMVEVLKFEVQQLYVCQADSLVAA